jgi:hypothetical protein
MSNDRLAGRVAVAFNVKPLPGIYYDLSLPAMLTIAYPIQVIDTINCVS